MPQEAVIWFPALEPTGEQFHRAPVSLAVEQLGQQLFGATPVRSLHTAAVPSRLFISGGERFSRESVGLGLETLLKTRIPAVILDIDGTDDHSWLRRAVPGSIVVRDVSTALEALFLDRWTSGVVLPTDVVGTRGVVDEAQLQKDERLVRDVSLFLNDPARFDALLLHDYGLKSSAEERLQGLEYLATVQSQAWHVVSETHVALNILMVDNDQWGDVQRRAPNDWQHLLGEPAVTFWFHQYDGRSPKPAQWLANRISGDTSTNTNPNATPISWDNIDIILQDIHLGMRVPYGYELAEEYFRIAPQAMVFLLTGMDVESLAASGVTHKADRTLSKRRPRAILWHYYSRFRELFGDLLWPVWQSADDGGRFTSRSAVRQLFGTLRRWQLEPEILFHGHALPEMVEHAFRHTAGVWQLAQDVLVPLIAHTGAALSDEERLLLCLGIWLHDVGHVGDDHFTDSTSIRAFHGSISDRHLLRNPDGVGLEWLSRWCTTECKNSSSTRQSNANLREGCGGTPSLCPLRRTGLMARYHQQSAPMFVENVASIIEKAKPITPYARVFLKATSSPLGTTWTESTDALSDASAWMDDTRPLEFDAHTVRLLTDFEPNADKSAVDLVRIELLLRWLDALHLHEARVGSPVRLETLRSYLRVKQNHVAKRAGELEHQLYTHGGFDLHGRRVSNELESLYYYNQLLQAQDIHHWIHASVRRIHVTDIAGSPHLVFHLDESRLRDLSRIFDAPDGFDEELLIEARDEYRIDLFDASLQLIPEQTMKLWTAVVSNDFIRSEWDAHVPAERTRLRELAKHIYDPLFYVATTSRQEQLASRQEKPGSMFANTSPKASLPASTFSPAPEPVAGRLLFDCTVGSDHALGMALAASLFQHVDVSASPSTVAADQSCRNASLSAAFVFESTPMSQCAIYAGASRSLTGDLALPGGVDGRDGLGDVPLTSHRPSLLPALAGRGIAQSLESTTSAPTAVFAGPLTTLALTLLSSRDPIGTLERLGRVFVVGGAFREPGNITDVSEYNCYFDPNALNVVLKFYGELQHANAHDAGLFFIPLDVTDRVQLFANTVLPRSERGLWLYQILQQSFLFHSRSGRPLAPNSGASYLSELQFGESYAKRREQIERRQRLGLSIGKTAPRFCPLRAPLAVWTARKLTDDSSVTDWFSTCRIVVQTSGELRGALKTITNRGTSKSSYQPGTQVAFLDPSKFAVSQYRSFLDDLFRACEWQMLNPEHYPSNA